MSEIKKTLKENLKEIFDGCLTIPNLISVIRILLIPVIAVLYYKGYIWWTVFVIFISGLLSNLGTLGEGTNNLYIFLQDKSSKPSK